MERVYMNGRVDDTHPHVGGREIIVVGSSGSIYKSVVIEELSPERGPQRTETHVLEERYETPHICRKV